MGPKTSIWDEARLMKLRELGELICLFLKSLFSQRGLPTEGDKKTLVNRLYAAIYPGEPNIAGVFLDPDRPILKPAVELATLLT